MRVSIIGLGKLGAPMAAVLAHKGHRVVGVDTNPEFVQALNEGRAPVREPGLDEMIRENRSRLSATIDYREAIAATEATFIIVPTPSEPDGTFSLRLALAAAQAIGEALRHKPDYHLVALSSTVMPGSTGGPILAALERASGKRCGRDFGLCYNPEFIALGSVIHDMQHPDMILIGESDEQAGDTLAALQRSICENDPPVARMNFINAEITKLSVNTFVTTKISYANMLAQVCERLPGADMDVVSAALGLDTRIGRKYLTGALGYGGPCFPRDNAAFASLARQQGAPPLLAEATDQLNRRQVPRVAELVLAHLPPGGAAAVLGLAYKPGTAVIEESQGLLLAQDLLTRGTPVLVYDPEALENARRSLTGPVTFASSAKQCLQMADVIVIATPWEEFRQISPRDLERSDGRPVIVDCWRLLERRHFEPAATYLTLGTGPPPALRKRMALRAAAPAADLVEQEI